MCLLVHVLLYHWKSIHIRSYGRIKWHRWRYMAARSGYIFIYRWQLVICSCAHLTVLSVCVYACIHRESGVNGEWRDFNSSWSTVYILHVVIGACVSFLECVWEKQRGRLTSIDESGEITGEGWRRSVECRPGRLLGGTRECNIQMKSD